MSQAQNGVSFILQVSPDGGTTWQTVAAAKKAVLKRKTKAVDVTTKDSAGDEEFIAGARNWQIDFDQLWVSGDAGQQTLSNAQAAGTVFKIRLQYNGSGNTYTGSCIVTDINEDMVDNEAVTYTGSVQGTAVLTAAGTAH